MPTTTKNVAAALALAALAACGGGSQKETLDGQVRAVTFGGTIVSSAAFYDEGQVELRVVPLDANGAPLLEDGMTFEVSVSSPAGVSARVASSDCVQVRERHALVLGVVVDASSSMAQNDPDDETGTAPGRRRVVSEIVDALTPGDLGMVTDFSGTTATPLRDLVCVASSTQTPPPPCIATAASLTGDFAALRSSTVALRNLVGTPLYAACLQMNDILGPFTDRKSMVILSDGLPDDAVARAECLDGARAANVSIYTVGFGTSLDGRTALRELAQATGGAYAPSSDPDQLARVLSGMAYSDGYCRVLLQLTGVGALEAGTPIQGEVRVGTAGARASFEVLAPPRS